MFRLVVAMLLVAITALPFTVQASAMQFIDGSVIHLSVDADDGDETVVRPVVDIEEG